MALALFSAPILVVLEISLFPLRFLPHLLSALLHQQLLSEEGPHRQLFSMKVMHPQHTLSLPWMLIDEKADTVKTALEQGLARFFCTSPLSLTQWQVKRSLVLSEMQLLSLPPSGNGSLLTDDLQWDPVSQGLHRLTLKTSRTSVKQLGIDVLHLRNGIVSRDEKWNVEIGLPTTPLHTPNNSLTTHLVRIPLRTPTSAPVAPVAVTVR